MRPWLKVASVAVVVALVSATASLLAEPGPVASVRGGDDQAGHSVQEASASLGGLQGATDPVVGALEGLVGDQDAGPDDGPGNETTGRLPDLLVAAVSTSPGAPVAGQDVRFHAVLANAGDAPAGNFTATIAVQDGGDLALVGWRFFGGLAPGQNVTFSSEPWRRVAGNHSFVVTVDTEGGVNESREDNNRHKDIVTVRGGSGGLPDLVVGHAYPVDDPVAGRDVSFSVSVVNVGPADATAFVVEVRVDGEVAAHQYFSGLPAGEAATFTTEPPWRGEAGTHEVRVLADSASEVLEQDEGNNQGWHRFEVSDHPSPDLEAAAVDVEPVTAPAEGEEVRFRVHYWNPGDAPARNFTVTVVLDSGDGRVHLGRQWVPVLGAHEKGWFLTDPWVATAGDHTALLTVDDGDNVREYREDNNRLQHAFRVGGPEEPDLVVAQVFHRESWDDGSVSFYVNVTNAGHSDAGAFTIDVRVDGELVSRQHVHGLAAGAVHSHWTEPGWRGEAGDHVVKVFVDAGDQVRESDERNNHAHAAFRT